MKLITPFRGLRPTPAAVAEVAAPPYDVVSVSEARELARDKPNSFLHLSRPEIDLPSSVDPYDASVYAQGASAFKAMQAAGVLICDPKPGYYIYRLNQGEHEQTGLVAAVSLLAYRENIVRKHEHTRPVKEQDRIKQIEALQAQTGPVMLAYRNQAAVAALIEVFTQAEPEFALTDENGVRHTFWHVASSNDVDALSEQFNQVVDTLYIADGHHRAAAASHVAAESDLDVDDQHFLGVLFPAEELQILPYYRVIKDLGGLRPESFVENLQLKQQFWVERCNGPFQPSKPAEIGMYLPGQWFRLVLNPELLPEDHVQRLDVSLLNDFVLEPLLGITDIRHDERVDFVGGARGINELERLVDIGDVSVAFALYPTAIDDLMAIADKQEVMPPKSTWFEPKLADGLISLVF